MDTVTQAVLGAAVGQAFYSQKLGRRAILWGVAAGTLPDLDMIPISFMGPWAMFLHHRGLTHALWFGPVVGVALGYAVWRWYGRKYKPPPLEENHPGGPGMLKHWIGLFVLALFTHPLLDIFTSYGTQILAPFSNHRFALHGVAIIDPLYTFILVAALVIGFIARQRSRFAVTAASVALVLTTAYLFYGLFLNERAKSEVQRQLQEEGLFDAEVHCYPTLFQLYLRRAVVRTQGEVRVGMITMWKPGPIAWRSFHEPEHELIDKFRESGPGRIFEWFALGETVATLKKLPDGCEVRLHDLRYGFHAKPNEGFWGIQAKYDRDGSMKGEVERFRNHPTYKTAMLGELWRTAFKGTPEEMKDER